MSLVVFSCAQNKNRAEASKFCMNAIFKKDSVLGELRNHEPETSSLSEAINNYVKNLDSLDFQQCPKTFEKAFQEHAQAWSDMTSVTDNYPDLRGELHDLFDKLEKSEDAVAFKKHLENIWATWRDIEAVKED